MRRRPVRGTRGCGPTSRTVAHASSSATTAPASIRRCGRACSSRSRPAVRRAPGSASPSRAASWSARAERFATSTAPPAAPCSRCASRSRATRIPSWPESSSSTTNRSSAGSWPRCWSWTGTPWSAPAAAARQVAPTDASVLLLGESGTGKSQLARFIHHQGRRAAGPIVEVHCAALPETLLEAELFGHEKGAFTGAAQRKAGHLAAADGGTLFLDEIGEITPATQVKLLRFLQDRTFVPVGATQARTVDVRVISATNRDLDEAVRSGAFREDFYYRLNVFAIRVPPIRDRREDVGPIAERFLASRGLPAEKLSPEARGALLAHDWPGNVRELENALERALIVAGEGELRPEHLAIGAASRGRPRDASALVGEGFELDSFERELLLAALARAGGNKTRAASFLGITRRRLYSLLASSGGEPEDEPAS